MPCDDLLAAVVDRLCAGEIGGWFEGGSELGPRALGQRSILCDARRPDAKDVLNRRVKHREPFRPFAPAVAPSLLDLVPRVVARRCTIDLALEDGQLGSKPGPDLRALVATPWGNVEQAVTADYLVVLQHMNGQRTGHDILAQLDGKLDDSDLLRALAVLRQLRIIELGASP